MYQTIEDNTIYTDTEIELTDKIDTAIADAMLFGYASHTNADRNSTIDVEHFKLPLDEFMEKATQSSCFETCARSIYFLWSRHSDLFQNLFLMRSLDMDYLTGSTPKPFTRDFFNHYVWGAVAEDGRVFFGSPNGAEVQFVEKGYTNPLSKVHTGVNLQKACTELQMYEQGTWPTAKFIQDCLDSTIIEGPDIIFGSHRNLTSGNLSLNIEDLATEVKSYRTRNLCFAIPVIMYEKDSATTRGSEQAYETYLRLDGICNDKKDNATTIGYWDND